MATEELTYEESFYGVGDVMAFKLPHQEEQPKYTEGILGTAKFIEEILRDDNISIDSIGEFLQYLNTYGDGHGYNIDSEGEFDDEALRGLIEDLESVGEFSEAILRSLNVHDTFYGSTEVLVDGDVSKALTATLRDEILAILHILALMESEGEFTELVTLSHFGITIPSVGSFSELVTPTSTSILRPFYKAPTTSTDWTKE
jgi:hypothetical protein